jgi:hypothetical protein
VLSAVALTLFVGNVPTIQDGFKMKYLDGREWGVVLGLSVVPAIIDELQKVIYRATKFGERPRVKLFTENDTTGSGSGSTGAAVTTAVKPKGRTATASDGTQMVTVAAASNGHKVEVKSIS